MWEPLAPSPVNDPSKSVNYDNVHVNLASHIGTLEGGASDKFFMCKSAIKDGMESLFDVFWNCIQGPVRHLRWSIFAALN